MFKYLAGIFAKPHNDYGDGRTSVCPSNKMAVGRHPHQMKQKIMAISEENAAPTDEQQSSRSLKRRNNEETHCPIKPKVQVLDPVSYIVNIEASSSSNDEKELAAPQPMAPKVCVVQPHDYDSNVKNRLDVRSRSSFLLTQIPGPPPVSRVQSWMSLNGDSIHDDATNAMNREQVPCIRDKDLCPESIPQDTTTSNQDDWQMGWLPEAFWSIDAVTVCN